MKTIKTLFMIWIGVVLLLSIVPAAYAISPVGQWNTTFYHEPDYSIGATQGICFQSDGTWYGTSYSWSGTWYRKGLSNEVVLTGRSTSGTYLEGATLEIAAYGHIMGSWQEYNNTNTSFYWNQVKLLRTKAEGVACDPAYYSLPGDDGPASISSE